jgi:hypothetical protein
MNTLVIPIIIAAKTIPERIAIDSLNANGSLTMSDFRTDRPEKSAIVISPFVLNAFALTSFKFIYRKRLMLYCNGTLKCLVNNGS